VQNCAGVCLVETFRLEYQVIALEYIPNKLIAIEAVCLNPYSNYDKELTFKLKTANLKIIGDKKLDIALSIINSVIKEMELTSENLRKLCIRDKKVFYITIA